jgi:hypothetical protein
MRSAYGDQFNEQMLLQLGMDRRILEQLLNDEAVLVEATAWAFACQTRSSGSASSRFPPSRTTAAFIGEARYRQFLGMQRPPMTPDDFEREVRPPAHAGKTAGHGHRLGARR